MSLEYILMCDQASPSVRATENAAGYDLSSADEYIIFPGCRKLISTGLKVKLPPNCYGRIAPRSGLALNHGIDIGAGVVDPDYTGELKVLLFNLGLKPFKVHVGDRVAQLICERFEVPKTLQVSKFETTERNENSFGSTGI